MRSYSTGMTVVLGVEWVRALDDCEEHLDALAWLAERGYERRYKTFIPPMRAPKGEPKPKPFLVLAFHAEYDHDINQHRISWIGMQDAHDQAHTFVDGGDDVAAFLATHVFSPEHASSLIVCNGGQGGIIDALIEDGARQLVAMGYLIEPYKCRGGIGSIKVRKGKRQWTVTSAEIMTGRPLATLLACAQDAAGFDATSSGVLVCLYAACSAYSTFLMSSFGAVLNRTVGMIAAECARRHLPDGARKWKPDPLLVAMERDGMGYRGGISYGVGYRGETHRIDVNRQYTAMLANPLPCAARFGKYRSSIETPHGVYLCTVVAHRPVPYAVGAWVDAETGFVRDTLRRGRTVCVLHTSEFEALSAWDCDITPGYGYTFVETFTLAAYVEQIAAVCAEYGRTSPLGQMTKPLGNMVYGKYGQQPGHWQLLYAEEPPDDSWHPHITDDLRRIKDVWERYDSSVTVGMHVDIAAHITGYARSQTMQMWALLDAMGHNVVRCVTDSITVTRNPSDVVTYDDQAFGAWKYENLAYDGIVAGANAYADDTDGHVAGVTDAGRAVLEALHANGEVIVTRETNLPREGFWRGKQWQERRLTRLVDSG